ncbi:LysR family transcriptional regulator [Mobilicoccus caccae]|uniref:LysR family transcriptional regulator n=1 Tax=Mobilicoccus caccae TaxID=1859295 RepID=A0ABQ6IZ52_9MICO|nr:LysR family transcriptional regulator [Mobilicoccus caccae]GMA41973.1 LysR family transcriptional regulator [Mobilicoccus caccae]
MLNPLHLQTLVTVLRTGSFADAARELGYTPSAVSQQIATLERSLKMVLFDRSARSITPTPTARLLAERSRDSLTALRLLEEDVVTMAQGRLGTLRVGSFPTASERLLPAAFSHFRAAHPQVQIRLGEGETDELVAQLLDGQIDVALVYRYDLVPRRIPADVETRALLAEDLLLIVPEDHELLGRAVVAWSDLADATWITTAADTAGAQCLERLCALAGFVPEVSMRSNDYDVVRRFVASGLGVALIPALARGIGEGLGVAPLEASEVRRHVLVLHRHERLNPAVAGFLASLAHAASQVCGEHLRPAG